MYYVDTFPDVLFDHVMEESDQYQQPLKQTTVRPVHQTNENEEVERHQSWFRFPN